MAKSTPAPATVPEITTFHSFDGGFVERASFCRPDRYRMVESMLGHGHVIARGGGYSYAAASFGAGSLVLDMTRFDRVLRFQPEERLVEVEAGACGLPLFLTRHHGSEMIMEAGKNGLWLEFHPVNIADVLETFVTKEWQPTPVPLKHAMDSDTYAQRLTQELLQALL